MADARSVRVFGCITLLLLALLPRTVLAAANPTVQTADGVTLYLGVVPAEIIRGHAAAHQEASMHGGARGYDSHVMVALFEAKSGARITNAEVQATVTGPKRYREERRLEPMLIASAPSFGNYFSLPASGSYRIEVRVRLPDRQQDVRTSFTWVQSGSGSAGHP